MTNVYPAPPRARVYDALHVKHIKGSLPGRRKNNAQFVGQKTTLGEIGNMNNIAESVRKRDIILVRKSVGHMSPHKKTLYVSLEMKMYYQTSLPSRLRLLELIVLPNMLIHIQNPFDQET